MVPPPGNDPRIAGYQPTVIPFNYRGKINRMYFYWLD